VPQSSKTSALKLRGAQRHRLSGIHFCYLWVYINLLVSRTHFNLIHRNWFKQSVTSLRLAVNEWGLSLPTFTSNYITPEVIVYWLAFLIFFYNYNRTRFRISLLIPFILTVSHGFLQVKPCVVLQIDVNNFASFIIPTQVSNIQLLLWL
jgi:hypothetical protein